VIVGQGALSRPDGAAVLAAAWAIARDAGGLREDWHGFNVLHTAAARMGALALGFVPGVGGKNTAAMLAGGVDMLWLLGADEHDLSGLGSTFVIYQGSHGDAGAARADVVLPGAAYTEKSSTWMNTEGRAQQGAAATFPPGEAREDWKILRAASAALGHTLPYDTIEVLRASHPAFSTAFVPAGCTDTSGPAGGAVSDTQFAYAIQNYYSTDPISRASPTMADCTRELTGPKPFALAAE
jgi:NADH-quinone oxidoreductase subunit G